MRRIIKNNRLVQIVRDTDTRTIMRHGKRVGKDCPLTHTERRAYVEGGSIRCAALMRRETRPGLSLTEIVNLIKSATGNERL